MTPRTLDALIDVHLERHGGRRVTGHEQLPEPEPLTNDLIAELEAINLT